MTIAIKKELIDHLYPANIFLDPTLRLDKYGPSIAKHFPDISVGTHLFDLFDLSGGNDAACFDLGDVKSLSVHLTSKCGCYKLAGTAIPLADDGGYLLAVRHVPTDKAFKENRFQISEFAPGDPTVQSLLLINLQRAMIEESQDTALELAFERQRGLELLDRVSRIAGYMAHDFNNFLSIIKLNCDRLSRDFGDNERIERLVSIIRETAARGSSITGSLMKLSHQRTDTQMPMAVDPLIEDNIAFLRTVVGSNVVLSSELNAGATQSVISQVRFINCLTNLLINSRDAMPDGGKIIIRTDIKTVTLDGRGSDETPVPREYIVVEVADNGRGMTEAVLSRAFEPLFSTKSSGNGFGLASALEFAQEMGGDARLESEPGKGAKVFLYLPTVDQKSALADDHGNDVAQLAGNDDRGRVLLVEDEPYALEALVEMLEAEGYSVTACETGEAALKANEQAEFDVLVTDIIMPGQRGTELARLACAQRPKLKIILMSGYVPDVSDISAGWMFIRKPMDSGQLLAMIEAAVGQSH